MTHIACFLASGASFFSFLLCLTRALAKLSGSQKKDKTIFWIATIIIFLFEGVIPLASLIFAPKSIVDNTVVLGYPAYFGYLLSVFKIMGVLILVIPKLPRSLKEWAYAGFGFDFIFASLSHLMVDGSIGFVVFPLVFLALLAVSYFYYHKLYVNSNPSKGILNETTM